MHRYPRLLVPLLVVMSIGALVGSPRTASAGEDIQLDSGKLPADLVGPNAAPPGKPTFQDVGVQPGQVLGDLGTRTIAGGDDTLLPHNGRPTLLVSGSYTCPISRVTCPQADELRQRFGDRVNVRFVYVIEAHPKGDPSPYSKTHEEDVTTRNVRENVLYPQPRSLDDRLALATMFRDKLAITSDIVVDTMANDAWFELGRGPNTALLLDPDDRVVARFGWYKHQAAIDAIDRYLGVGSAPVMPSDGAPLEAPSHTLLIVVLCVLAAGLAMRIALYLRDRSARTD
ncbi:MAG: hypothetical protein GC159_14125 [Phycisphaera sp.]|nr:hypothetical protein [Phycisphaera sp.]